MCKAIELQQGYIIHVAGEVSLGVRGEGLRNHHAGSILNIIQKRPNTGVHLTVDEAMEGRTRK